jgi:acetyl-CoA C-acetyltransferase
MKDSVVIVAAKRTPIGAFQGQFAHVEAPQLGAAAIGAAVAEAGVPGSDIDQALMGCCLMAGLRQAPARQAVLGAGLPDSVPCTTLSKMCGSGMQAAILLHDMLLAGSCTIGVAGGMESMTNAPYLLPKARAGNRLGHSKALDHLFYDGLENAYDERPMGYFADLAAQRHRIGRDVQDAYAAESVRRAQHAVNVGVFKAEIAPVGLGGRTGNALAEADETPGRCDVARIPQLRPVFIEDGTITPANASSISDGAAALVLMRESEAQRRGVAPLARIAAHAVTACAPADFPEAPASAIHRVLERADWDMASVDLFEINEAFAVVTLLAMNALQIPHERVNVNGGACALGHPIGATGARIIVTLVHALRARGLKRGVASLCIGGGEATAIAIEAV